MRALLLIAALGACKGSSSSDGKELVNKLDVARKAPTAKPTTAGELAKRGSLTRKAVVTYGVIPRSCTAEKALAMVNKHFTSAPSVKVTTDALENLGWDVGGEHELIRVHAGPDDAAQIDKVKKGVVISAEGAPGITAEVAAAALEAATACNGWVIAMSTGQLYDVEQAKQRLPIGTPDARKLIVLHSVTGENELNFIDTLGMSQMGFPELSLHGVPTASLNQAATLMNAAAQALIEQHDLTRDGELAVDASKLPGDWHLDDIRKDGGTGTLTWTAKWQVIDEDGQKLDPPELELFPPGTASEETVNLIAAIDAYFGKEPDDTVNLDAMRDDLTKAGGEARAALTKLLPTFAKGIPINGQLGVKAPFQTDRGGIEWMWIDVFKINATEVEGTLDNDPDQVSGLKAGAHVTVKFDKLADFIYRQKGEKTVGGFSLAVMKAHGMDVPALDD